MWLWNAFQIEFDERELRREIGITIRNIHGIRSGKANYLR